MMDIIKLLKEYEILINAGITFLTIIVSLFAIICTNRNAKIDRIRSEKEMDVQKRQYEEQIRIQKEQFDTQLSASEKIRINQEKPYLIFKEASISKESDEDYKRIDFSFINKGRGAAYGLIPELKCEVTTLNGKKILSRCEPVTDPIVLVGECFLTMYTLGYKEPLESFETNISLDYEDASGRKYKQKFRIIYDKKGYSVAKNFPDPILVQDD